MTFLLSCYASVSSSASSRSNIIDKYLKRIVNKARVLLKTVLLVPILHTVLGIFEFRHLQGITSIPPTLWIVLGIIGITEFGLFVLLFLLTPSKFNPFSQHPYI